MSNVSDPFMRLLEQMGRALGAALSKLTGLKQYPNNENGYEFIAQCLQTDFDIDLQQLIKMEDELVVEYLLEKSFHITHIEQLSQILMELAEVNLDETTKYDLYRKSYLLINYVLEKDKTYSLARQNQLAIIQTKLNS
jgi:hypothetical protein